MSRPARAMAGPQVAPDLAPRSEPVHVPERPSEPRREVRRAASRERAHRRAAARRRGQLGFFVLSSLILGSMIFGLVSLNALLAQSSFRVDDLERRIAGLSQENLELTREQAKLSAPGRVAAWATRQGMRLPDDLQILHVPSPERAARPGADPSSEDGGGR